jgi:hypothetical protein
MANRNFPNNKLYQTAIAPARLDVKITIGASGAVSSSSGSFLKSVTKLSTGTYEIRFQDIYNRLIGMQSAIASPIPGSAVSAGSLITGTSYRISTVGTSDWSAVGLPSGLTAAVGMSFVATGTTTGTGFAKAVTDSGIAKIELLDAGAEMSPANSSSAQMGAIINIQTMGPSFAAGAYTPAGTISQGVVAVAAGTAGDAVTNNAGVLNSVGGQDLSVNAQTFTGAAASLTGTVSYVAANAASGSVLYLSFLLDSSSVTIS